LEGSKKEKIEIAKNLLKQKVNLQIISTATGLSESEIKSLSN
jgi:hypothetical protein